MHSKNSAQTKKFAARLAREIIGAHPPKIGVNPRRATVVALIGDLGAGKTTFTQGFSRGLGLRRRITSPTFLLVKRLRVKGKRFNSLFHIDCYRLQNAKELPPLGIKKILRDPKNIVLIEWADKIKKLLPRETIWIHFTHGGAEHERHVDIRLQNAEK